MTFTWPPKWLTGILETKELTLAERVVEVLEATRDYFVNTHWTKGTLYAVDSKGKKHFCAVGGFCQVLLDKQEGGNELTPRFQPSQAKVHSDGYAIPWDNSLLHAVFAAERELAIQVEGTAVAIKEGRIEDGRMVVSELVRGMDGIGNPDTYEGLIIHWNDFTGRNSATVVQKFNDTIERVLNAGLTEFPYIAPAHVAAA